MKIEYEEISRLIMNEIINKFKNESDHEFKTFEAMNLIAINLLAISTIEMSAYYGKNIDSYIIDNILPNLKIMINEYLGAKILK